MFSSLPDYRRFAESALRRLRKDQKRTTCGRLSRIVCNLVILTGLWGLPLYARWMVVSEMNATLPLSWSLLGGEWRSDDGSVLLFTWGDELRLIVNGTMIESANYRIVDDELEIGGFMRHPGDRPLPVVVQRYQVTFTIRGDRMTIVPAKKGFTPIPEKASEEGSRLRLVLPPFRGTSVVFHRADEH
jgi:hypothetical protein